MYIVYTCILGLLAAVAYHLSKTKILFLNVSPNYRTALRKKEFPIILNYTKSTGYEFYGDFNCD
jgi:hypothetical protein